MNRPFELLRFSGPDAAEFLQGQLTQDLRELQDAGALLAAYCSPKGRVITVLRLVGAGEDVCVVAPADMAEALIRRFAMYRLRARVDVTPAADWRALAVAGEENLAALASAGLRPSGEALAVCCAGGITALTVGGSRHAVELYGRAADFDRAAPALTPLAGAEWRRTLIEAGIPTVTAAVTEKHTPHMLNLDRLGAVSFDKGCYTGQEVVARTEHLGRAKRRLARYRLQAGAAAPGDRVLHGDREAGEVVDAAGGELLAVVPIELHGEPLTVNGHAALPQPLPYATA